MSSHRSWRQFVEGSAQRVIAHAKHRASRGKGPAMPYGNIRNSGKALQAAQDEIESIRLERFGYAQGIRKAAYSRERVWRDDWKSAESPTARTVVACAKDLVDVSNDNFFSVRVVHVKAFYGKGFMCQLHYGSKTVDDGHFHANGKVHYGEGQEAYDNAAREGGQAMWEAEIELAQDRKRA